jgi:hypothetical protein
MIILVTGGRDFQDRNLVEKAMAPYISSHNLIVQGGAKGADALAKSWASRHRVHCAQVDALWSVGPAAGHYRNTAMLWLKPDLCVAFPGGRGTADMISQCKKAGVPVLEVQP